MLSAISCPLINGQETNIDRLFKSDKEVEANRTNTVASYLVIDDAITTRPPILMLFFSIRTGELFRQTDYTPEQIELATDMLHALNILQKNKSSLSQNEIQFLRKIIKKANDKGIYIEQAQKIVDFHTSYIKDTKNEPSEGINRVLEVFSGIELKLFGVNDEARARWQSFNMPQSRGMGETLF